MVPHEHPLGLLNRSRTCPQLVEPELLERATCTPLWRRTQAPSSEERARALLVHGRSCRVPTGRYSPGFSPPAAHRAPARPLQCACRRRRHRLPSRLDVRGIARKTTTVTEREPFRPERHGPVVRDAQLLELCRHGVTGDRAMRLRAHLLGKVERLARLHDVAVSGRLAESGRVDSFERPR